LYLETVRGFFSGVCGRDYQPLDSQDPPPYDTINKLELGRRPAHASTIRKLAGALDVEPRELMKGKE